MLKEFQGMKPEIEEQVFIASGAKVIGNVTLKEGANVWFNSVLRGDLAPVEIGEKTNIQDGTVGHVDYEQPLIVGNYVTVGHGAILHGCTIKDGTLIGMGATIMNGAVIGEGSIVAAGTLIPENKEIPPGSVIMGVPGKVVRELSQKEQEEIKTWAEDYHHKAMKYQE